MRAFTLFPEIPWRVTIFLQMIPEVKADEPCITKEGYQLVAELIQHLDEVEAESAKR